MPKSIRERLAAPAKPEPQRNRRTNAEIRAEAFREAVEENSRPIERASRRAGKVREYTYEVKPKAERESERRAPRTHSSFFTPARTPTALSPEAQWMEDKPDDVSPIDWMRVMPGFSASVTKTVHQMMGEFRAATEMILSALTNRGELSMPELVEDTGLSRVAISSNLRVLADVGLVKGDLNGLIWKITEED